MDNTNSGWSLQKFYNIYALCLHICYCNISLIYSDSFNSLTYLKHSILSIICGSCPFYCKSQFIVFILLCPYFFPTISDFKIQIVMCKHTAAVTKECLSVFLNIWYSFVSYVI